MNLADAIREAASKALLPPGEVEDGLPTQSPPEAPSHKVVPQHDELHTGSVVRLEMFLSPEQMSGLLKSLLSGHHTVLTLREAASYLRISQKSLEALVENGDVPAIEIEGRLRFPKTQLDEWLLTHQAKQNEEESEDLNVA